jgi:hypothetical protein
MWVAIFRHFTYWQCELALLPFIHSCHHPPPGIIFSQLEKEKF